MVAIAARLYVELATIGARIAEKTWPSDRERHHRSVPAERAESGGGRAWGGSSGPPYVSFFLCRRSLSIDRWRRKSIGAPMFTADAQGYLVAQWSKQYKVIGAAAHAMR